MNSLKVLRIALLSAIVILIPVNALAHPGHEHSHDWLNIADHAALGWDQLLIVFAIAAVAARLLARLKK